MSEALMSEAQPQAWISRARIIRFVVYALVLLASVLWQRHERLADEAIAAVNEAIQSAYTLVEKASSSDDPAERLRLYEEIINTWQNDTGVYFNHAVSLSMYSKAMLITDTSEKSRLFEEVVAKYGHDPDTQVREQVRKALFERLEMPGGEPEETLAICDMLLGKEGRQYTDGLSARLLNCKAEMTPDTTEKIALNDRIIHFISSDDGDAFDYAVIAAINKLELIDDKNEQIRLCDIAIAAFLTAPQKTRPYLFDQAIRKKARLVGDPSLPLMLLDLVIAKNLNEDAVLEARVFRMSLLKDDDERLAAYNETISAHQNSASALAQTIVAGAMAGKAELIIDTEAKAALWQAAREKFEKINTPEAKKLADWIIARYDEEIVAAENTLELLRLLKGRANIAKDTAEKIALYDEIIRRGAQSSWALEIETVQEALYEKAEYIDNKDGKKEIYDTLLFDTVHIEHEFSRGLSVFWKRFALADDDLEKLSLYDRYIDAYGDTFDTERKLFFLLGKTEFLTDPAEKSNVYDELMALCEQSLKNMENNGESPKRPEDEKRLRFALAAAILGKADLAETAEEKIELYEHFLTFPPISRAYFSDYLTDYTVEELLFKKADLSGGSSIIDDYFTGKMRAAATDAERLNWYQHKICQSAQDRQAVIEAEIMAKFFNSTEEELEGTVALLLLHKIKKTENAPEKAPLLDRLITRYQDSNNKLAQIAVIVALSHKAEITADDQSKLELYSAAIEKYQDGGDEFIQLAVNEVTAAKAALERKIVLDMLTRQLQALSEKYKAGV